MDGPARRQDRRADAEDVVTGMRATGPYGEVRYGYQVAARTGKWTIETQHGAAGFAFTALLAERDEIWLERKPLDLVLALGPFEWIWRDVLTRIEGSRIEIALTRRPDVARPRADDIEPARMS